MNEYTIGYLAVGALVGLALTSLFYMLGGRSGKWRRRFVASAIQTVTSNLVALGMGLWHPMLLAIYPILVGGFSLGYGADEKLMRLVQRIVVVAAILMTGVLYCFHLGWTVASFGVLLPHAGIALWSVWMGMKNPIYAAAEEVFICAMNLLMLNAYPFVTLIK